MQKTSLNNMRKTSVLKNTLGKGLKKTCEIKKDVYFCTRIKADVL